MFVCVCMSSSVKTIQGPACFFGLDFAIWILGFKFGFLDVAFRILRFGFCVLNFAFWISHIGFCVLDFVIGIFAIGNAFMVKIISKSF